jgi:ABC-type lipoprotein release transport system permease subunit
MSTFELATLAWRNLWRQKRRTILTLCSIAFGGFLAVLMTAMQDQSFADFIDTAARLGSGHVVIQHPDYADAPSLTRTVSGTDALRTGSVEDADVDAAVDRTSGPTMLSTASDSFGAMFIAYDPQAETEQSFTLADGLDQGEMFETADDKGIILGTRLAQNLGAEIGDKVVFTLTDRNGEIVAGMGRLRGTVKSGAPSLDSGLCLLPLGKVRDVLGYDPTESTQVGVFLDDSRRALKVRERLADKFGDSAAVLTWDQVQPELSAFIAMKVGGGRVFIGVIILLVTAGIFNTLFVSVMERVREFGIMLAVGYSPRQLFRMVMWESAWLAMVGMVAGVAAIAWPYWWLSTNGLDMTNIYAQEGAAVEVAGVGFDMIMRIGIFPDHAIFIAVMIFLTTMAAGLYPAWKAGRIEPVETIRLQ